ncbi:MAG: hypothetical protein ACYDBB_10245 [Armatimonadota bacterium]
MRNRVCNDRVDDDMGYRRLIHRERLLATHAHTSRFRFLMIAGMGERAGRGSQQERTQQHSTQ